MARARKSKDERITIRFTDDELAELDQRAAAVHLDRSTWIRQQLSFILELPPASLVQEPKAPFRRTGEIDEIDEIRFLLDRLQASASPVSRSSSSRSVKRPSSDSTEGHAAGQ